MDEALVERQIGSTTVLFGVRGRENTRTETRSWCAAATPRR
jgi:hypothetical protein